MKILDKIFSPSEEVVLTDEEKMTIADFMCKNEEVWRVQKKYFYYKINKISRQLAKCTKEELTGLQEKLELYGEIMSDFEQIKKNSLKKEKKDSRMQKAVRDTWFYITGQDIKEHKEVLKRS